MSNFEIRRPANRFATLQPSQRLIAAARRAGVTSKAEIDAWARSSGFFTGKASA